MSVQRLTVHQAHELRIKFHPNRGSLVHFDVRNRSELEQEGLIPHIVHVSLAHLRPDHLPEDKNVHVRFILT
jgi:hypothetical protein